MKRKIPDYAYTHSGIFHADDIFGAALLQILNKNIKIIRINDVGEIKEKDNYIVFDIGLGEFDHHQTDKKNRSNGVPYAAFGLLWQTYGYVLLNDEKAVHEFDKQFIQALDNSDNNGTYNSLCDAIKSFNRGNDTDFDEAVKFAKVILENKITKLQKEKEMKIEVAKIAKEKCNIACLKHYISPKLFIGTEVKIIIYPSDRDCYHVQIIPKNNLVFSDKWMNDISKIKKDIPSFLFCNEKRYLIACKKLEDAITIAELELKQ